MLVPPKAKKHESQRRRSAGRRETIRWQAMRLRTDGEPLSEIRADNNAAGLYGVIFPLRPSTRTRVVLVAPRSTSSTTK